MSAFWSHSKGLTASTAASLPRTDTDIRQGTEAGPAATAEVLPRGARSRPTERSHGRRETRQRGQHHGPDTVNSPMHKQLPSKTIPEAAKVPLPTRRGFPRPQPGEANPVALARPHGARGAPMLPRRRRGPGRGFHLRPAPLTTRRRAGYRHPATPAPS